jgi:hypothetical protein
LGGRLVYKLKVILGYEKIMDPKDIQTLERRRGQKK